MCFLSHPLDADLKRNGRSALSSKPRFAILEQHYAEADISKLMKYSSAAPGRLINHRSP